MVARTFICPPQLHDVAVTTAERQTALQQGSLRGRYGKVVDRESAYELLKSNAARQVDTIPARPSIATQAALAVLAKIFGQYG